MAFIKSFVAVLAALSAVSALPILEARQERCNIPPPNPEVARRIVKVALDRGNPPMGLVMIAMMDTAIQETNVNNLNCGDKDSVGVFQQRSSQGWGSNAQILNIEYSTGKFLDLAERLAKQNPNQEPHTLAQKVQRAEAGDLYSHDEKAKGLIRTALQQLGVGSGNNGPVNVAPKPTPKPAPKPAPTSDAPAEPEQTTKPPKDDAPAPPKDDAKPEPEEEDSTPSDDDSEDDVDDANDDDLVDGCTDTYVPTLGDNCYKVASKHGLTLDAFYELNPCIDNTCSNLYAGQTYCVKKD